MRTIEEVYLVGNPPTPVVAQAEMADVFNNSDEAPPKSKRSTPQIKRVPQDELELTYLHNPTIFNGINKIQQTIMSAQYEIVCKDKKIKKYFDDFIANVGNSGSDFTWDTLLAQIFKYQCIYGWAWVENIYNKKGTSIVDWDLIDPKKMDYAKNTSQNIVLNKFMNPVGYVETLPMTVPIEDPGLPAELANKVTLPPNSIFLETWRVSLLKLYQVGDGFYPIGLIEPIYKSSIRKMNIEHAMANAIWRHGFPIVVASVGDTNHEPTPQQVNSILSKLKDVSYKQEMAIPFYYKLEILESKKAERLREHLEYFKEQEIAGMGIPKPFATGGGEATNRATLGNQSEMFLLTLRDIIERTSETIQRNMFRPICELEGFKEVPTLRFDALGLDELDKKAKRLLDYLDKGVLSIEEVKDLLKRFEKIDGADE